MDKKIKVVCYGKAEYWEDREAAKMFYFEAMMCSDGAERNRYSQIFTELSLGYNVCTDGEEEWR